MDPVTADHAKVQSGPVQPHRHDLPHPAHHDHRPPPLHPGLRGGHHHPRPGQHSGQLEDYGFISNIIGFFDVTFFYVFH